VNVGREDQVNVGQLIDFVCTNADVRGRVLGRIRLQDKFSFVEVEDKDAANVLKKLDKSNFEGKKLKVEYAKPRN
jgi:ATP-dependent RNA helicase DeaD